MYDMSGKSNAGLKMVDMWVFIALTNLSWIPLFADVSASFAVLYVMSAFLVRNRKRWVVSFRETWL